MDVLVGTKEPSGVWGNWLPKCSGHVCHWLSNSSPVSVPLANPCHTHLHVQESPKLVLPTSQGDSAARVQAAFSTAQFVCLFAHNTASILFIRERSLPPMAQKQFTG